ncbi:MAG: hypothetical protein ACJ798_14710 [Phenylobacterium sp.]
MAWRNWLPRLVLAAAVLLYLMIGAKFVLDPDGAATQSGLRMAAAVGRTNVRAGLGGFPLGIAATLAFCLVAPARTVAGLRLAAGITGAVLAVRLAGAAADGALIESARLLAPETLVVALSLLAARAARRSQAQAL